jgi:hypothetical protein
LSTVRKDQKTICHFNHYIEETEAVKITKEFEERVLPTLHDFIDLGLGFQDGQPPPVRKKHFPIA